MPEEILAATLIERNAPAKLRIAHNPTATRGRRSRVAIEVAMALAVSWNPFVKSKAIAVATTITRRAREPFTPHSLPAVQVRSRAFTAR